MCVCVFSDSFCNHTLLLNKLSMIPEGKLYQNNHVQDANNRVPDISFNSELWKRSNCAILLIRVHIPNGKTCKFQVIFL